MRIRFLLIGLLIAACRYIRRPAAPSHGPQSENLVQLVRDVDHRHALGLESGNYGEKTLDLGFTQGGSGFVEDKQARVQGQCLGDFGQLLFPTRSHLTGDSAGSRG